MIETQCSFIRLKGLEQSLQERGTLQTVQLLVLLLPKLVIEITAFKFKKVPEFVPPLCLRTALFGLFYLT